MQQDRLEPLARAPRRPQKNLILWLLFLGIMLSFCGNIYQDQRAEALARNIASVRQDTQKQIAELRESQTALLEQDLLRLDQLTGQVQKTSEDILQQSTLAADRTKAELARTVEQRHQEMIRALSDIRSDVRATINVKQNQGPNNIQDASAPPERPARGMERLPQLRDRRRPGDGPGVRAEPRGPGAHARHPAARHLVAEEPRRVVMDAGMVAA